MNGRTRDAGLGPFPAVTLAVARETADKWRKIVASGKDPIERRNEQRAAERVEAAKAMTFDDCSAAYIAAHEAAWRNAKHRQQWTNTLRTYVTPVFGKLPVQSVDVALVLKVIEPMWVTKPETANRVRGRIETVLDWAKARELRTGENPARWRGHLEHMLPPKSKLRKVKHHPALPFNEVGAFMMSLRKRPGIAAAALEFVILNATRTTETLGAAWSEVDLQAKLWIIPGERMKGGEEHRVPLSDAAVAVLKRMEAVRQGDLFFPGGKEGAPLSDAAMATVIDRMNAANKESGLPIWVDARVNRPIVPHGFRSSFRDWAAERTAFPREIAEKALAHIVGDETERAYQRGDLLDKRRKLMDAWAAYCAKVETAGAEILPIARRA
jgi:integrase